MSIVAGSIIEVNLAGRIFSVPADTETNRELGGWSNDVEANGDGSGRMIKTRVVPVLDGLVVSVDDVRGDAQYLKGLADANDFFAMSVTYAGGEIYQGQATITDKVSDNSMKATCPLVLKGVGEFTKQGA